MPGQVAGSPSSSATVTRMLPDVRNLGEDGAIPHRIPESKLSLGRSSILVCIFAISVLRETRNRIATDAPGVTRLEPYPQSDSNPDIRSSVQG